MDVIASCCLRVCVVIIYDRSQSDNKVNVPVVEHVLVIKIFIMYYELYL